MKMTSTKYISKIKMSGQDKVASCLALKSASARWVIICGSVCETIIYDRRLFSQAELYQQGFIFGSWRIRLLIKTYKPQRSLALCRSDRILRSAQRFLDMSPMGGPDPRSAC